MVNHITTHGHIIIVVKPNLVTNIREHDNTIIYVKPNRNNNVKTNKSNVKVNTRKPKNTRKPR